MNADHDIPFDYVMPRPKRGGVIINNHAEIEAWRRRTKLSRIGVGFHESDSGKSKDRITDNRGTFITKFYGRK